MKSNTYNTGGKPTEKRTIKISIILYSVLLCCAAIDLVLSYNYFVNDTEIFVSSESNVEFVHFLTEGDFPVHNFIKFIIALPLLLFLLSWFDLLHENISGSAMFYIERFGRTFTLAIPGFFCISYAFSGFTWYTNSHVIYDILSMTETMIRSSIIIVACSLFLLTFYLVITSFFFMQSTKNKIHPL
jgi:hypothetical protein